MKRNNVLLKDYKARTYKKLEKGGLTKPLNDSTMSAIGGGAGMANMAIDALDPVDKYGTRTGAAAAGSGALKGAMAGAALGPIGMGVGAVVGGVAGFIGNKNAQEAKQDLLTDESKEAAKEQAGVVDSRVAADPTRLYGNKNASMYAKYGGTVKGKPSLMKSFVGTTKRVPMPDLLPDVAISPGKMVRFPGGGILPDNEDPKKKTGIPVVKPPAPAPVAPKPRPTLDIDAASKSERGILLVEKADGTVGEWGMDPSKTKPIKIPTTTKVYGSTHSDGTRSGQLYQGSPATTKAIELKEKLLRSQRTIFKDGGLIPLSSDTVKVEGPKHEKGGVKIGNNVEVEGGETIAGDFVFSEELGIAAMHEKTAKAKGKNEKRPSTALNKNTQKALVRQEGNLKLLQESYKKAAGMPNEIDNTAAAMKEANASGPVIMRYAGKLPKPKKPVIPFPKFEAGDPNADPGIIEPVKTSATPTVQDTIKINQQITEGKNEATIDLKFPDPVAATGKKGIDLDKAGKAVGAMAPFVSNLANAFRKLPEPPKPKKDSTITPETISLDAERAEATRQRRGADKSAAEGLNGNNQVAAVKAANLSQQMRETNKVNETEQNINTGIKNQAQQINASINRSNSLKDDMYNTQKVERQLKQQELNAENLADVGNKVQASKRDKAAMALEEDKMLLTAMADPTSATIRGAREVFKRRLSPEAYKSLEELETRLSKTEGEDRKLLIAQAKSIMNTAKESTDTILADAKAKKEGLAADYLKAKTAKVKK